MIEKFYPDLYMDSVYKITASFLKDKGLKGIILDIDNTLVPMYQPHASEETIHWINNLIHEGIKVCILSNARLERVRRFCIDMEIPYFYKASKPKSSSFIKASTQMGLKGKEIAMVGDQIFTDIIGGNRLNMYTILVKPINPKELVTIRFKRLIEKIVLKDLKRKNDKKIRKRNVWKDKTSQKIYKKNQG